MAGYEQEELDLNSWRSIDESIFVNQINELNNRIREVATRFRFMVENNDYDKTWKLYYDLMTKDLANNGWIHTFYQQNKADFPSQLGSRPEWYSRLTDKERYQYDSVNKYFEYMPKVDKVSCALYNVLVNANMRESFRVQRIRENMEENYFSEKDYQHFVEDAHDVETIINTDWNTLEGFAKSSEDYYLSKAGKKDYDQQKYRLARVKDYQAWVKRRAVAERMTMTDAGNFFVNAAAWADAQVVDKYMEEIAKMDKLEDDLKKKLEECIKFELSVVPPAEKEVQGLMLSVVYEMRSLNAAFKAYLEDALKVYDGFKKGSDAAPYCFMKKPWSLASPKKKYAYQPSQWNPIESGTKFRELYDMEAQALTMHCYEFAYKRGHMNQ